MKDNDDNNDKPRLSSLRVFRSQKADHDSTRSNQKQQQKKNGGTPVRERLLRNIFGNLYDDYKTDHSVAATVVPIGQVVVLLWLYRENYEMVQFLSGWIEMSVLQQPSLVDNTITPYLAQLVQVAEYWDPASSSDDDKEDCHSSSKAAAADEYNTIERLLLILAQLSTRFAVQYRWTLQALLQEHRPDKVHRNHKFDMATYARWMVFVGNLDRCMQGHRRTAATSKKPPRLEITTKHGGKVVSDEFHLLPCTTSSKKETNETFFQTIVDVAHDNATQRVLPSKASNNNKTMVIAPETAPFLQHVMGGVLLCRKAHRRKQWKRRYFCIQERRLNCYSRERQLLRSMPLDDDATTVWKGSQKQHPRSFVVAHEDGSMFYLRAFSEEQAKQWKCKILEAIHHQDQDTPSSKNMMMMLSDAQKERHQKYVGAIWFGRMLTKTTSDLERTPVGGRSKRLHETFFELDMPKNVHWPWDNKNSNNKNEADGVVSNNNSSSNERVYVVLPHFCHLLAHSAATKKKRDAIPLFQASFLKKAPTTTESDHSTNNFFLSQGRKEMPDPCNNNKVPQLIRSASMPLGKDTTSDGGGSADLSVGREDSTVGLSTVSSISHISHRSLLTIVDLQRRGGTEDSFISEEDDLIVEFDDENKSAPTSDINQTAALNNNSPNHTNDRWHEESVDCHDPSKDKMLVMYDKESPIQCQKMGLDPTPIKRTKSNLTIDSNVSAAHMAKNSIELVLDERIPSHLLVARRRSAATCKRIPSQVTSQTSISMDQAARNWMELVLDERTRSQLTNSCNISTEEAAQSWMELVLDKKTGSRLTEGSGISMEQAARNWMELVLDTRTRSQLSAGSKISTEEAAKNWMELVLDNRSPSQMTSLNCLSTDEAAKNWMELALDKRTRSQLTASSNVSTEQAAKNWMELVLDKQRSTQLTTPSNQGDSKKKWVDLVPEKRTPSKLTTKTNISVEEAAKNWMELVLDTRTRSQLTAGSNISKEQAAKNWMELVLVKFASKLAQARKVSTNCDADDDTAETSLDEGGQVERATLKYTIVSATSKGLVSLRTKPYQWREMLAVQLANYYESTFANTKIWVGPPRLQRISESIVITEAPRQAITLADAKASVENGSTILDYFVAAFGPLGSESFQLAQQCLVQSLAGLSVLSYLLGIKNRHDGNLMIDSSGHIFASDFSCVFGRESNGLGLAMEVAPFKLTKEYIDLMGGTKSSCYKDFCFLFDTGLRLAHDNADFAIQLIRMAAVASGTDSKSQDRMVSQYRQKLIVFGATDEGAKKRSKSLIEKSQRSLMTSAYDALANRRLSLGAEV